METIKLGSKGESVKMLQEKLNVLGASPALSVDGDFGSKTERAVKLMQAALSLKQDGIVGPLTWAGIEKAMAPETPGTEVPPTGDNAHMKWMEAHIGEKEIPGSRSNPLIREMFRDYTDYGDTEDETPWCAACRNMALAKGGYKYPYDGGAAARASLGFFPKVAPKDLQYGDVLNWKWASGHRHVGFFHSWANAEKTIVNCLGGNQSNMLKISQFNIQYLEGAGRPVKKAA